jgi:hypothetical protein
VLLSGPDAVGGAAPSGGGGDAYAISAAGNTVAVVYYSEDYAAGIPAGLVVRASTDGGQTWSAPQLLMLEQYSKVYVDALVPPDTVSFHTDTIPTLTVMSVLVDPDGGWHLAATIIPTRLEGKGILRGDTVDLFEAAAYQKGAYLSVGALYGYWAPGEAEPSSASLIAPPAGSSVEPGHLYLAIYATGRATPAGLCWGGMCRGRSTPSTSPSSPAIQSRCRRAMRR